ncbi:MAG: hypothetical protein ACLQKY_15515 [Terracidiphilus sp.]
MTEGPEQPKSWLPGSRWVLRDSIAAALLFVATASVVLWQNAHVAALFDVSYILNTAQRIALGQMPYRRFPLPHAPFTFLIQAAIIRLTGRVYFHHVLYVAFIGGLGTVLTWRIALHALRERIAAAWTVALLVAAPLAFLGIYCILPNPEYDCDCGFWIVVAVWLLQRLDGSKSAARGFVTGALLCAPLFFKQNMGLPFFLAAIGAVLLVLAAKALRRATDSAGQPAIRTLFAVLAGACATLLAAALTLHWTAGLRNYYHWTIEYAGQRRMPGLSLMLGVYRDSTLLWTVPCVAAALVLLRTPAAKHLWAQMAAFALLAAPFLFTLASLLIYDDADERGDSLLALWPLLLLLAAALAVANIVRLREGTSLRLFLPLILLAAIHGTFLSQQLWGSTYGIWPLLVLLVAELLVFLDRFLSHVASRRLVPLLAGLISITLLVCGGFYTASEERLSYADLPDGPPAHSAFPALAGLSTPGPYLPEIDEVLRYAQANIPADDGIVLIPGEEPFYFATGRAQRFPVLFFDPTIDPYSPAETAALVRSQNIRWLIVKSDVQTKEDPTPDRAALMQLLMSEFTAAAHLSGYDVYRR